MCYPKSTMTFNEVTPTQDIIEQHIPNLEKWRQQYSTPNSITFNDRKAEEYYEFLQNTEEPWLQQAWETPEQYSYFFAYMNSKTNRTFANLQRYLEKIDPHVATTPNMLKNIAQKNFWLYRLKRSEDQERIQEDQVQVIQKKTVRKIRFDLYEALLPKLMEAIENLPTGGIDWKDIIPAINFLTKALQSEFPDSKNPLETFMRQRTVTETISISSPSKQMSEEEKYSKIMEVLQQTPGMLNEPSNDSRDEEATYTEIEQVYQD